MATCGCKKQKKTNCKEVDIVSEGVQGLASLAEYLNILFSAHLDTLEIAEPKFISKLIFIFFTLKNIAAPP